MSVNTHVPVDWNELLTTTMHNHRKELTDNIFNSRPLLQYLMSNGRVRTINGGISIVEPIIYAEGDAKSYSQWDTVDVTPQGGISAAQFPWKQLVATIAISGLEEAQNNGREQIINLLEAKVMQAEETLKNLLSNQLYADNPGANDFGSLMVLVDDTAPAGGIDPTDPGSEFWRSVVQAVGAVNAAGLEAAMRTAYNDASDGGSDKVDAMFAAQGVYEFYESTLTPQVRYTDVAKANLGFQNLLFKAVPIFFDANAPAGVLLGLNSKYVGLVLHNDRNFAQSKFTDNLSGSVGVNAGAPAASALDARISFITTYGNATIRNRRRCFKLTGIAST